MPRARQRVQQRALGAARAAPAAAPPSCGSASAHAATQRAAHRLVQRKDSQRLHGGANQFKLSWRAGSRLHEALQLVRGRRCYDRGLGTGPGGAVRCDLGARSARRSAAASGSTLSLGACMSCSLMTSLVLWAFQGSGGNKKARGRLALANQAAVQCSRRARSALSVAKRIRAPLAPSPAADPIYESKDSSHNPLLSGRGTTSQAKQATRLAMQAPPLAGGSPSAARTP